MAEKMKSSGRTIDFVKMAASGNDFVILKERSLAAGCGSLSALARMICDRKFGAGADGMLLLEDEVSGGVRMRIFNSDGSEAEMCGNGARCAALFSGRKTVDLHTKAGLVSCRVDGGCVRIRLTAPKGFRGGVDLPLGGRVLKAYFVNTGVPHAVVFVQGLDSIDVDALGRMIRYHKVFSPAGANVDFAEITGPGALKVRTYERGVEGETLACGTGSTAAALSASCHLGMPEGNAVFRVLTRSGETLRVYFDKKKDCSFSGVWLEGGAKIVYKGVYYV